MMRPNLPEGIEYELLGRRMPMREPATAAELAEVIVYVASDAAGYIYGQNILADGGSLV
jgi:NAD(P)-dependent dehydrogenase (short-subunit alcohol dehydrogenase family)